MYSSSNVFSHFRFYHHHQHHHILFNMFTLSYLASAVALASIVQASPLVTRTNTLNCYTVNSKAPTLYFNNSSANSEIYLGLAGYHLEDALKAVGSKASAGSNPTVITSVNVFA